MVASCDCGLTTIEKTAKTQKNYGRNFLGCSNYKVMGIPWDVDTDGLKKYMSKFGDLEDCIVMKERSTGTFKYQNLDS